MHGCPYPALRRLESLGWDLDPEASPEEAKLLGKLEEFIVYLDNNRNRPTVSVLDEEVTFRRVRADLLSHGPWQQFADAIDGMVGDASNDVSQVGLGVETVQLG
ncbi:hypothetical protein AWV80_34100 [Cupriavidus sp. UYMU48A]|nr:hypothetical protein AWV80_34100 [Cupriavidus sp. UYMU48A]